MISTIQNSSKSKALQGIRGCKCRLEKACDLCDSGSLKILINVEILSTAKAELAQFFFSKVFTAIVYFWPLLDTGQHWISEQPDFLTLDLSEKFINMIWYCMQSCHSWNFNI